MYIKIKAVYVLLLFGMHAGENSCTKLERSERASIHMKVEEVHVLISIHSTCNWIYQHKVIVDRTSR